MSRANWPHPLLGVCSRCGSTGTPRNPVRLDNAYDQSSGAHVKPCQLVFGQSVEAGRYASWEVRWRGPGVKYEEAT